ncbi:MAG: 1,6-anhydro-N-acetylmuramyl-L-alanine amidase AmpD [Gammaproteobacteria bacterium]|nr:1,6-anhydro-N-acetylmuramyl-L-alanine amidase AmpD [Gammaproteobacteria bacterium]
MHINTANGLLEGAKYIESPNCDERSNGQVIDLLVIHNISLPPGEFGGPYITHLFTNTLNPQEHPFFDEIKELRVSAHLLIRRDGQVIQYVPLNRRAWHAGVSNFCGREKCNDFSIGIEMEGTDTDDYEDIQYQKLAEITREIQRAYPQISLDNIQGHCDIAPERKTDPGESFNWAYYKSLIKPA